MKVIGLAGWSGAGKTTLLARVIPHLLGKGLRVSVIKHAHHEFDVDVPGKDSWVHRQSGASEVLVSSTRRWALMHELRGASEPRLPELLAKIGAGRSRPGRGFQARAAPQDRGASRRQWQAVAVPRRSRHCRHCHRHRRRDDASCRLHLDDVEAIAAMMQAIGDRDRRCACESRSRGAEIATWRNCPTIALPLAAR